MLDLLFLFHDGGAWLMGWDGGVVNCGLRSAEG